MKLKSIIVAMGFGLGAMTSVHAATVSSQFFIGNQQLSDNSAEYLVNCTPGTTGCDSTSSSDTTVDIGDRLVGIFDIGTIEQGTTTHLLGTGGVNELTGVFDATVTSKSCAGSICTFTFEATAADGTAITLYEDDTPNFTRLLPGTIASNTATATDGTVFATLGVEFWNATSTLGDNIGNFALVPFPGTGGTFDAGLNFITNFSGLTFGQVSCLDKTTFTLTSVDVCGSGELKGIGDGNLITPGVITPFQALDNIDFQVNVVPVPEPGSLALIGLGLLAAFGRSRRRLP